MQHLPRTAGFTLVEVLIALAILAISLTAIVKATSSDIQNTAYLKNKAFARLVANEAYHLIKLNAVRFEGSEASQKTRVFNQDWQWKAEKSATTSPDIIQVKLMVLLAKQPIITDLFYLYRPK